MKIRFFCSLFLLLPILVYAQQNSGLKDNEVDISLDAMETEIETAPTTDEDIFVEAQEEDQGRYAQNINLVDADEDADIEDIPDTQVEDIETEDAPDKNTTNAQAEIMERVLSELESLQKEKDFKEKMREWAWFAFGEKAYLSLGLQEGRIKGETTYHISFDNDYAVGGHGESELRWPLDNNLMGIYTSVHYKRNKDEPVIHDRARLDLEWWFARFDKDAGKMRDYDWIQNDVGYIDYNDGPPYNTLDGSSAWASNHEGIDIYSESVAKLDGSDIFDAAYTYNFWPRENLTIGPRLGYRYQRFRFSSYSLDEFGYGPYGPGPFDQSYKDERALKWGEYKVTSHIPYMGLSSELTWKNKFSLFFKFGYSNLVRIKDQDTHLYPTADEFYGFNVDMVSKGHCKGTAYLTDFGGDWKFWPNWLLSVGATHLGIEAKGKMNQSFRIGELMYTGGDVGEKITTKYWVIKGAIRYVF